MEPKLDQPIPWNVATGIKMILGGFLVVVGLLATVGNLGLLNTWPLLRLWPLVLVLIGLLKIFAPSGPVFGAVLVAAGAWMTAVNLHLIRFSIFDLWPLILVGAGAVMVAGAFGWRPEAKNLAIKMREGGIVSVLASRNVVEKSRDYRGGSILSFLGGSQVDLSGASMTQRPAVIDATAILGGIEILVPDDWQVSGEVVPVMGGFEMKCDSIVSGSGGELLIRGMAFMGGVEVKSVRRTS